VTLFNIITFPHCSFPRIQQTSFATLDSWWVKKVIANLAVYNCQDGLSMAFCTILSCEVGGVSWREKKGAGDKACPFPHCAPYAHHTPESRGKYQKTRSLSQPTFSNAGNHLPTPAKIRLSSRSNS
jgi:hypothetical protein